jgi:protein-tyrosine phosphatase
MSFFSQIAQITDVLCISSEGAINRENLLRAGVTDIINCTVEGPDVKVPGIVRCTRIKMDDSPDAPLSKHFDKVADDIDSIGSAGGKVLVHCVAGISRSSTLCIAYLMKHKKMTLIEAHGLVKKKRPIIRPNMGFWQQLIKYEKDLFGSNTVNMVSSPIGYIPDIYKEQTKNMI